MKAIAATQLTAVYKSGKGVFNLSFSINSGGAYGFLGPNGAGKTTTIRALMGFINLKHGSATVLGKDCRKQAHALQANIGYLPGEIAFYNHLTGAQFLKLMSDLRKTNNTALRDELIALFDLDTASIIKKMSKGTKQKLGIVTAMMHDPALYILDEPTSGLDPLMRTVFLARLKLEKKRGKTLFVSSHDFDEVEQLCDNVGMIKDGKLVNQSDIETLKQNANAVYTVRFATATDFKKLDDARIGYDIVDKLTAEITMAKDYDTLFGTLSKCQVLDFSQKPQTLEDTFMQYYKKGGKQ